MVEYIICNCKIKAIQRPLKMMIVIIVVCQISQPNFVSFLSLICIYLLKWIADHYNMHQINVLVQQPES